MAKLFRMWVVAGALVVTAALPVAAQQDLALGAATEASWRGVQAGGRAGALVTEGAVSRDGRRDLIIGAPGGPSLAGALYVVFGGPARTGESSLGQVDVQILGAAAGDEFGYAAAAGNVLNTEETIPRNLVVGAPGALGGRGIVYMFPGGYAEGSRLTTADAVFRIIGAPGDRLGEAVLTGDLDNDNHREIIVGAPGNEKVYVIRGRPTLTGTLDLSAAAADFTIPLRGIGRAMAVGDLTGDALEDLVLGSPSTNFVYVISNNTTGALNLFLASYLYGIDAGDEAGSAVRVADLDGDKRSDLLVGAPGADGPDHSRSDAGEAYIVWGGTLQTMSLASAGVTIFGGHAAARVGAAVNTGDINRDAPDDIALLATPGTSGGGDVYLIYGALRTRLGTALPDGRRFVDLASRFDLRILGDRSFGTMRAVQIFEVTGEGARDVVVGIPDEGGTGVVRLALSPKLTVTPRTFTLSVFEGAGVSRALTVSNLSPVPITWTATKLPAWITLSANSGVVSGPQPMIVGMAISSAGLPIGTHTGNFTISSTSRHLEMDRQITVSLTVERPRHLQVDLPAPGLTVAPGFIISGWAVDTAAPSGSGMAEVLVTAIANNGAGASTALGPAQLGLPRADVSSRFGAAYNATGFQLPVPSLPAGVYRFVVTARSAVTTNTMTHTINNVTVLATRRRSPNDLNGDGMSDLIWRHTDGRVSAWMMNGTTMIAGGLLTPAAVDTAWKIVGTGDVNQDGKLDLFWHNRFDGRLSVWIMDGTSLVNGFVFGQVADVSWQVAGVGDLNRDGHPDLVWRHNDGTVSAWLLNGTTVIAASLLSFSRVPDLNWRIVGVGDMNGDGRGDLVWRNVANGQICAWFMDGFTMLAGVLLTPDHVAELNWEIAALSDMNGDGTTDLVWRHRTLGWLSIWFMNGTTMITGALLQPVSVADLGWTIAGPK